MELSLEDAYAETCRALGEAVVSQRLMNAEIERLRAQNESLMQQLVSHTETPGPPASPTPPGIPVS